MYWHPVWGQLNLESVLDDFYWARELRQEPQLVAIRRRNMSNLGSLELSLVRSDYDFQFSCATVIAKDLYLRVLDNNSLFGTAEILNSPSFDALGPFFKRSLLVASTQQRDVSVLTPELMEKARLTWELELSNEEQTWWLAKSRAMSFTPKENAELLKQGIHPLLFVHREHSKDLALFQDINPDIFRSGYALNELLKQDASASLSLPDMDSKELRF